MAERPIGPKRARKLQLAADAAEKSATTAQRLPEARKRAASLAAAASKRTLFIRWTSFFIKRRIRCELVGSTYRYTDTYGSDDDYAVLRTEDGKYFLGDSYVLLMERGGYQNTVELNGRPSLLTQDQLAQQIARQGWK